LSLVIVNATDADKIPKYQARKSNINMETPEKFFLKHGKEGREEGEESSGEGGRGRKEKEAEGGEKRDQKKKAPRPEHRDKQKIRIYAKNDHEVYGNFEIFDSCSEKIQNSDPFGLSLDTRFKSVSVESSQSGQGMSETKERVEERA
jgi:hypothetical protein